MSNFKMDDYVPVQERIEAFYAAWPQGTLQSEIVELTPERVTVKAYAYRTPDDALPGIGHSSLEIPGSTSFTRGSEIENAETSAWGRSIAALGFEVKRGVSSREEVANKQSEQRSGSPSSPRAAPTPRTKGEALKVIADAAKAHGKTFAQIEAMAKDLGIERGEASIEDLMRLWGAIEQPSSVPAPAGEAAEPLLGDSAASTTPLVEGKPDSSGSAAATAQDSGDEAVPPGTSPDPALAPDAFMDKVMAVTGGELVPPKPGTDAYRLLPDGVARSKAKAWHEAHPEPDEPTLAEQLTVPA